MDTEQSLNSHSRRKKIIYCVDIHGSEDNFRKLLIESSKLGVEAIIIGGDINIDLKNVMQLKSHKLILIPGECDDIYITKCARELNILSDGVVVDVDGIRIGCVGGLAAHQSIRRLYKHINAVGGFDILVTHFPPKGCLDNVLNNFHSGLKEVRDLVLKYSVKYVFTGHYHDNIGVCILGTSVVINPGPLSLGYYLMVEYIPSKPLNYTFMKLP